jgi:8-hydroxy-5-deazaflavin:NADPH oxidoreductase
MTTIRILGAGNVGRSLAKAGIDHGYDIVIANSRTPDTLRQLVAQLGDGASAASAYDVAEQADFAVAAVYLPAITSIPVKPLEDKVVIGTMNYIPDMTGHVKEIDDGSTTVTGLLQTHLPKSQVVCGFTMLDAADMSGDGHSKGDPRRRALPLAADNLSARKLLANLYDEFGFDPVDIGDLQETWRLAPGQPAFAVGTKDGRPHLVPQTVEELRFNVAAAKRR